MQRVRPVTRCASFSLSLTRRCFLTRCTAISRCHRDLGASAFPSPEPITPEMVMIEVLPAAAAAAADNDNDNSTVRPARDSAHIADSSAVAVHQRPYWDVTRIDNFSRSRVLNYVRRTAGGNQGDDVFQVSAEEMAGRTVYRARCRLVLPAPHHSYVAEGIGEDAKDAELLSAMHAERVCDALGVPLFRLPSMQQKHAEAARREGRYAPMPGDPICPEHTRAPPPLRMVRGTATRAEASVFAATIAEAEIVEECFTRGGQKRRVTGAVAPAGEGAKKQEVVKEAEREWDKENGDGYHTTVHYPWQSRHYSNPGHRNSGSHGTTFASESNSSMTSSPASPSASSASAAAATIGGSAATVNAFDPTEGGQWEMSNTLSARCSPSPDALLLPCVYETAAHDRLTDHFLQQGRSLRDCVTTSHVAVSGHSSRMYVSEIRLFDAVVARGKAPSRDTALHLAAMHAELLLDALARPLFPRDGARQARHAAAAGRFGRWAPNPLTGDTAHPRPGDALPRPLKQQVGGDEVWLDPQMMRRGGYQRSVGERIIAAHNEINTFCGDYIEANPDTALLAEARRALEVWQREVARNPFPDLFVITRMGDQFRASTVVPVPREFGTRGGNGVGKTMEQAMDLCALHAVDTLSALGIPVYADPTRQAEFNAQRRKAGLVLAEDMQRFSSLKKGLIAVPAPSYNEEKNNSAEGGEKGARTRPPYLPGYMVEGNQPRPLPHIRDTLHILQLRIPEDFTVYGEHLNDEAMVEVGNEAKVCVQNYLRHNSPKNTNVNASVYITGYGRQVSVHNIAYLPLVKPIKRGSVAAAAQAVKKKKKKNASNKNSGSDGGNGNEESAAEKLDSGADVEVNQGEKGELPESTGDGVSEERLLAVGISLKKKDAERVCYLHAVDILRSIGQDVLTNYRAGLPRRKIPPTPSPPKPQEQQQESIQDKPQEASKEVSFPSKPYMHKLMMQFMSSGKHYTAPKKRLPPGPFSPF